MEYLVSDIIEEAKVAIDENVNSEALALLGDTDTLTLDEIIRSKVEDAARLVESRAAHHLLDAGKAFGDSIDWESEPGYGAGRIHLPDDFCRLISFQMSDWSRAVVEPITEEDPRYLLQSSRYVGVRGNPERPVVTITQQPIGLVLEFFSCTDGPGAYVKRARYLPMATVRVKRSDGKEYIWISEKLRRAVVYRLASMTAAIVGASELSAILLGTSNELAGIRVDNA